MARRFLEATPLISQGFEVEAELSLQATVQRFPVAEVPVRYRAGGGEPTTSTPTATATAS